MREKLKKLFAYYGPYKKLFYSDMFFAILGAAVTLIIPLVVRYITNEVVYFDAAGARASVLKLGAVMVALVLLEIFCNFYIAYFGHIMGARMEADMRRDIFGHYQKLTFAFYDNQKVGHLLSRITSDLFDISELLHHGPEDLVISVIKIIGSFTILLMVNVKLALVAFAFIPVMAAFAFYYNGKMGKAFQRNREKIAEINSQIEDSLSGIRVVKSFANEREEMKKFKRGNDNFVAAKKVSYKYMGIYNSGLGAMSTLITVVVLVVGVCMMLDGAVTLTDLITFLLYINNFTDPVKKLVTFTEQFQNGYSGFERFLEILSIAPDIKDKPEAVSVGQMKGEIEFKDVSFQYEEQNEKVLNHINLKVDAGDYMALVGPSGVGKTTMCSLIPRFYEVSSGAITIDGIDIRDMKLDDLRSNVGIVQQDVYLFSGTVLENILYGNPDASKEDAVEAAKKAGADAFIRELKDGYDTYVGERGVKLSGGQKQRISIARVFLKNPPIMILDEATSALDNESEFAVAQSLHHLSEGRTTITIAHRLSSIKNSDRILVLTDQGITEEGNHESLMAQKGTYYQFYTMAERLK